MSEESRSRFRSHGSAADFPSATLPGLALYRTRVETHRSIVRYGRFQVTRCLEFDKPHALELVRVAVSEQVHIGDLRSRQWCMVTALPLRDQVQPTPTATPTQG